MTRIAYFDAFSGISGDMTVGALIDAGAPAAQVIESLDALEIGARYEVEKTIRGGITASKFRVHQPDIQAKHRHLNHIVEMIDRAAISPRAKSNATSVFNKLGEAEAAVHGVDIKQVHFHEVGAADSIADIVGACVALDLLKIDQVHVSAINVGSGTVNTEHGLLPVPAPATARLLEGKPIYARGPEMELTTPTGAALAATLATSFGPLPAMRITSMGYGAGDRDFKNHANVLRALIGERTAAPESTLVSVIEANIDDSSPQVPQVCARETRWPREPSARRSLPLQMKKNRPGSLLRVIDSRRIKSVSRKLVFAETSTLGLRIYTAERRVEERRVVTVETPYGPVRGKLSPQGAFLPNMTTAEPFAERRPERPLPQVLTAANEGYA